MKTVGFPGLEQHALIHKDLLAKFGGHVQAFEASGSLPEGLFPFLKMWLSAHVRGIDRKYGDFANQKAS